MFDGLTRGNIGRYVVREIGRLRPLDARVKIIEMDGHRAVFKDMSGAPPLFRRLFGRRLIAREFAIYRALDGVEGVPRACRMIDRDGFLIEYIDNVRLRRKDIRRGAKVPPEVYERCMRLVGEMHRRCIVHFDLRNRKNFLFDKDGRVYLVDFASAVRVPAWLPFRKGLVSLLGLFDRAGMLKMKRLLSPEQLTPGERRFLGRFELVRSILFPPALVRRIMRRRRRDKGRQKEKAT